MTPSNTNRGYVASKLALEMDNTLAGWLLSADGGMASADVISERVGQDLTTHKHTGPVKYDEITVRCGTGMSKSFLEWLTSSLAHNHVRQDGAVIAADFDLNERLRLEFRQAMITEFGLPALDASSKDSAVMTVKFAPEYTRLSRGGGGRIAGSSHPINSSQQKRWLPSNFRLRIDGLEKGCSRVSKVEALTIKQKVVDVPKSDYRDGYREPAAIEYSNLVVTLPESHADEFFEWHRDFVIEGRAGTDQERTGSLEFLDGTLSKTLFTVDFDHLGVFKVTPDKLDTGASSVRMVKVEMYCETMAFKYGQDAVWA